MGKLDGKIALVTGGSTGIGFATAQQFIAEGAAHVFITGRRQEALDEAVKKLGGKNVTAVQGDTSNLADIDKLYDVIKKQKGHLDIIFANAGGGEFAPLGSITEKHFDDTFNINVKGVLFTIQKALPIFKDGGSIILNASIVSVKGIPAFSVYSATKAAIRSFARTWTVDLKERKIRVNALSPGAIDTPGLRNSLGTNEEESKLFLDTLAASTPMNRIGTPDEIAKAAVFLASDDSSYITGIELFVDGGTAQI
jgi:NAD(P)-dependent dehydrogenase (short-subunit alcohol dehydrogenase family)